MAIKKPVVSIGLPVYNGERYVGEAIESLLSQTLGDFELIISDNASTDATEPICRNYADRDSRVKYSRNAQNIGANANFNRVVQLATAKYFKWAAADDLCEPTYLERCVEILDRNAATVLCHTRTGLIDPRGRQISATAPAHFAYPASMDPQRELTASSPVKRLREILMRTQWCFEIFGLIRRDSLLTTGLQGTYYGSDKVVLATLSLMGPFHEVPETLFLRRCHPQQSTSIASASARAAWSSPTGTKVLLPQIPCMKGYAHAVRNVPMFNFERARCGLVLARYVIQPRKLAGAAKVVVSSLVPHRAPAAPPRPTAPTYANRLRELL